MKRYSINSGFNGYMEEDKDGEYVVFEEMIAKIERDMTLKCPWGHFCIKELKEKELGEKNEKEK